MTSNNKKVAIHYLIKNIQQELVSLEEIYSQIRPLIEKVGGLQDQESRVFYNRAAGSILHDFYTGIEKIFHDIAGKLDKDFPKGENWHIELLKKMARPYKSRPEVISSELMEEAEGRQGEHGYIYRYHQRLTGKTD